MSNEEIKKESCEINEETKEKVKNESCEMFTKKINCDGIKLITLISVASNIVFCKRKLKHKQKLEMCDMVADICAVLIKLL